MINKTYALVSVYSTTAGNPLTKLVDSPIMVSTVVAYDLLMQRLILIVVTLLSFATWGLTHYPEIFLPHQIPVSWASNIYRGLIPPNFHHDDREVDPIGAS